MSKTLPLPPLERLNELFEIVEIPEADIGIRSGLVHKISRGSNAQKGGVAGCICSTNKRSVWRVGVNGKLYYVSRIIYYMAHTIDPCEFEVDHINQNSLDNNVFNLRLADRVLQNHNQKKKSSNSSGVVGVSWFRERNKWRASYSNNGVWKHIGLYACKLEAAKAYNERILSDGLDKFGKPLNDLRLITCECSPCHSLSCSEIC